MIQLQNISKSFSSQSTGLQDVSFAVEKGECVALLGPSGSGKTTLLRLIAGLEKPNSGSIVLNGQNVKGVPPHRRGVSFVAQKPALYPQLTVLELISATFSTPPTAGKVDEIIQLFKLGEFLKRRPHELSGGEKQRVALARTVLRGTSIWLLDEPFAPLDPPFRAEFRHLLHLIAARCSATILFVTHDPIDAWALGRRVGVLGDGRLQCFGPPEELAARPGNRFVAFCLGRFCFIEGSRQDHSFVSDDGSVKCPLPKTATTSNLLTLGIRPRGLTKLAVGDSSVHLHGWTTTAAVPDGGGWLLTLSRGESRLNSWMTDSPVIGETANWSCPLSQCEWFDGVTSSRLDI